MIRLAIKMTIKMMISEVFMKTSFLNISLFILAVFTTHSNGFQSVNFCKLKRDRCKGAYDSLTHKYTEICQRPICKNDFPYHCTFNYCTKKEADCDLKFKVDFHKGQFVNKKITEIKECWTMKKNSIKKEEFCLNGKSCKFKSSFGMVDVRCHCPAKYSYECSEGYCTVDSETCEVLNSYKFESKVDFNQCMNGNKIFYQEKFLLNFFSEVKDAFYFTYSIHPVIQKISENYMKYI